MQEFPFKDPSETRYLSFDCLELFGATITGTPTVTVHPVRGADLHPGNLKNGDPTISGSSVIQCAVGGVEGVDYIFHANFDTSDGRNITISGILPIRYR